MAHPPYLHRVQGLAPDIELLKFGKGRGEEADWYNIEMAVSGIPCVPFSVPVMTIQELGTEQALGEYLSRQAQTMLQRYGDRRVPSVDPALLDKQAA